MSGSSLAYGGGQMAARMKPYIGEAGARLYVSGGKTPEFMANRGMKRLICAVC
jgi:hypothetical protein